MSEVGSPFPKMFWCDRLEGVVTRTGCVLRQHKVRDLLAVGRPADGNIGVVPPTPADPRCADCVVGDIQKQILHMESERERNNNGSL